MPEELPELPQGVDQEDFEKLAGAMFLRGFEEALIQRGHGHLVEDEKTAEQALKVAGELRARLEEQEEVLRPMRKQAARETLRDLDKQLSG